MSQECPMKLILTTCADCQKPEHRQLRCCIDISTKMSEHLLKLNNDMLREMMQMEKREDT